jgi:hypothetical protein
MLAFHPFTAEGECESSAAVLNVAGWILARHCFLSRSFICSYLIASVFEDFRPTNEWRCVAGVFPTIEVGCCDHRAVIFWVK